MHFYAIEFETASEAIQHVNASGRGAAILFHSRNLVVTQADANLLAGRGIEFAYLGDHEMPDGTWRIVTVPVND